MNKVENQTITNQPKKKINWLIIGLAVASVIFVTLFILQSQKNKELTSYFEEEQLDLEDNFRSLVAEYDSLQVVNNYDSLLVQLDVEQQRVAQLLDELETVKATNAVKLREYRKELGTMRKVMKHYVVQIDSLNRMNEALAAENTYVKQQYQDATNKVLRLRKDKEQLSKTIAIASQLEARDMVILAQNSKGRKMRKLSKTERFQINFSITKNITTEVGNKVVYLRITSPQREVLPSTDEGQFEFEDAMLSYSAKREFEYEAEDIQIELFYMVNSFLFAGEYQFDLFVDDVHIGHQTIELKG